jgi:hypothetical protein
MPLPPDDSQVIEEGKNLGEPEAVAVPSSPAAEQAKSDTAESKPETNEFGIPSDSAHEAENPAEAKPAEARDAEPEKATSEKSWLLKVAENTKAIFTTLSSLFLSILLLVLIISLCRELTHSTVILELLDVPEDVKDNGLTASAFSGELSDRISSIQKLSLSKNTRRLAEPIWDQPDIQVPGSNISFRSVSQWLKQRIDLPGIAADIRLSGELIEQNGKLRLVVRRSDQSVDTSSAVSAEGTTIAELISKGAESITRLIDPVTLASYYSFREDRNMKYRKTIDVIKYTIASGDDESKARAYNEAYAVVPGSRLIRGKPAV